MLRTALAGYPPGGVAAAAAAADGAGRAPSAGTAPAAAGCASFGDASSPVDAQFYVDALDAFPTAPPFTVQRLCELLLDPLSYYRTQSALAHALDTLLRVTSVAEAAPPLPAAREARRRPRAPAASDSDVLIEERRRPASQGGMDGDGGGAAMSP